MCPYCPDTAGLCPVLQFSQFPVSSLFILSILDCRSFGSEIKMCGLKMNHVADMRTEHIMTYDWLFLLMTQWTCDWSCDHADGLYVLLNRLLGLSAV